MICSSSPPETGGCHLPDSLPTAHPAVPLNLNFARTLAWQHLERHLHLGLIGLQQEVRLGEQPGGGPNALLLHSLLEVLRNLEGSDCRQKQGQGLWGSGQHPTTSLHPIKQITNQAVCFGVWEAQSLPVAGQWLGERHGIKCPGAMSLEGWWLPEGLSWPCSPCPQPACLTTPFHTTHDSSTRGHCSSQVLSSTRARVTTRQEDEMGWAPPTPTAEAPSAY